MYLVPRVVSPYLMMSLLFGVLCAQDDGWPTEDDAATDGAPAAVTATGALTLSSDEIVGPDLGNAADTNASGNVEAASKSIDVSIDESDGTSVTATADITGFPFVQNGNWGQIDWKVDGANVIGTVHNRDGTIEGTFEGTVTASGVSGKFTHRDGRVGKWSWNGPAPAGVDVPAADVFSGE